MGEDALPPPPLGRRRCQHVVLSTLFQAHYPGHFSVPRTAGARLTSAMRACRLQEKELGNAAYKGKRFEEAIQHYDR